jgi:hypothetical protein
VRKMEWQARAVCQALKAELCHSYVTTFAGAAWAFTSRPDWISPSATSTSTLRLPKMSSGQVSVLGAVWPDLRAWWLWPIILQWSQGKLSRRDHDWLCCYDLPT